MTNENLVKDIIALLGNKSNIRKVENCMTRLRFFLVTEDKIDEAGLKHLEGVLGVVHTRPNYLEIVVGPGKCRKCADICQAIGLSTVAATDQEQNQWKANKAAMKSQQKQNTLLGMLKTFGEIFVPLIPGVILAGLCAGMATLLSQSVPGCAKHPVWGVVFNLLQLVSISFMAYLSAWAGYKAAERFGATPILGGMLGMITNLGGINAVSGLIGLFDTASPLNSILRSGRGGVLAAVIGVWFLAKVEKKVRSKMPDNLDIIFTPLVAMLICVIPYVLVVMPLTGMLSTGLCKLVENVCMSEYVWVRMLAGYIATVLFLPMVAMGMHHGLVALYTVQLANIGYVTLYPALAMAGAGQVGAAIAIYLKCQKVGNERLQRVIKGALPAGILGVGEPLIYGVTLPLGRPFLTAGLGAGFGGAFLMAMQVASTTWGPSGILAFFVMTAGPNPAAMNMVYYGIGLVISYIMGFILTKLMLSEEAVREEALKEQTTLTTVEEVQTSIPEEEASKEKVEALEKAIVMLKEAGQVNKGEAVMSIRSKLQSFTYIIKDPIGLHARPAGAMVQLIKNYDCQVTIKCNDKIASGTSIIQLLQLGADKGSALQITAEGKEASQALIAIMQFLEKTL